MRKKGFHFSLFKILFFSSFILMPKWSQIRTVQFMTMCFEAENHLEFYKTQKMRHKKSAFSLLHFNFCSIKMYTFNLFRNNFSFYFYKKELIKLRISLSSKTGESVLQKS